MRFMTAYKAPALVLLFAALASSQTTWYVDQASTAFPLGTQSNPFTTVGSALSVSSDGDHILIAPGTYYLTPVTSSLIAQSVSLSSTAGPAMTTISMNTITCEDSISMTGLTLRANTNASDFLFQSGLSHFTQCKIIGISFAILDFASCDFDECQFMTNDGVTQFGSKTIDVFGAASFAGCVVNGWHEVLVRPGAIVTVSSTVFYGYPNGAPITVYQLAYLLIENTVYWGTGSPTVSPLAALVAVCNCVLQASSFGGVSSITADPLFVDAANGDFHLMPGSPCINAGTNNAIFIPTTDIDGEARIQDGIIDIGVDEADASLVVHGPCGAGNVGVGQGGPFNLLKINNSSGGIGRRVDVPVGQSITISMDQPITNPFAAPFIIYGLIGAPVASDATVLPSSLGTMCFPPSPLVPGYPLLFTLANSVSFDPSALVPAIPAPWSISDSNGLSFPFQITFQGVIFQYPATVRVTNGVILNVQ